MSEAAAIIAERAAGIEPVIGLVLGSGLGALADAVEEAVAIPYGDLPGFPSAGVSGHVGRLVLGRLNGVAVAVCQGRAHAYEHGDAGVMRPVLETLQAIGCEGLVLTNAAGSLRSDMPPGALMLITDHLNLSGLNPLVGETSDARFTAMTGAYDPGMADTIREAALAHGDLRNGGFGEGVYAWMLGPSFETPAEIRMLRTLGADAVGMSTVPEVILARRLGLKAAAVSTITNMGAGLAEETLSHAQTKREGEKAAGRLIAVLKTAMPGLQEQTGHRDV